MATPLQPLQHRRYGRLPSPGRAPATSAALSAFFSFASSAPAMAAVSSFRGDGGVLLLTPLRRRRWECGSGGGVVFSCSSAAAGSGSGSSWWEDWRAPPAAAAAPRLSDVVWPSAGAFMAMAVLGKMDQMMAPTGLSLTIAPLGAVCAVLFATPSTPGARKYNMFLAQIGCAAFGVLALSVFGPGWLARSTALAASVAFMIITRAIHPPAASLPILFIDGAKFHNLHFWYALFPGATGCILLCLIICGFNLLVDRGPSTHLGIRQCLGTLLEKPKADKSASPSTSCGVRLSRRLHLVQRVAFPIPAGLFKKKNASAKCPQTQLRPRLVARARIWRSGLGPAFLKVEREKNFSLSLSTLQ